MQMNKQELGDLIINRFTPIGFMCRDSNCKCIEEMGAGEYAQRDTARRIAEFINKLPIEVSETK